jgi:hypothetical protein
VWLTSDASHSSVPWGREANLSLITFPPRAYESRMK